MKKIKWSLSVICIIMCIILGGCDKIKELKTNDCQEQFDKYLDEVFREEVTLDLISLNYNVANPQNFGITEYRKDYGSTDISELGDDSETIQMINELKAFDYKSLSNQQKETYDILMHVLQLSLEYSDLYLYSKTFTPTIGINCQLPAVLAEFSFRKEQDVYDYLELIDSTDEYFDYLLKIEKMKAEKGIFMEDVLADKVIEQCNIFIEDADNNYLIEIFDEKIDNLSWFDEKTKQELKDKNKEIIQNTFIGAYKKVAEELSQLKGSNKYAGGLCNYPEGKRYYEYLVKEYTNTSLSPQKADELVDRYIEKGINKIRIAASANPSVFSELKDEPFGFEDPYEIIDDLKERITSEYPELCDVNYNIKYVHKSLEENMSPAYYMIPPVDEYKDNVIYINKANINDDLYLTLAHEGFPGHLYQTVYAHDSGIHPIRSLLSMSGYSEGWATYTELRTYLNGYLPKDQGLLLFGNKLVILCIYAKCDIGVNYYGWGVEDVKTCINEYLGDVGDDVIDEIYLSMVSEPGNYLKYVIGGIEFMQMREDAEIKLGDKFDAKEFHDILLSGGERPFDMVKKDVDNWIKEKK